MSTVMFWTNLFLLVIAVSQAAVINVHGTPVKKEHQKIVPKTISTTNVPPKSTSSIKKSNARDPRFLGKLSFVAGLHLPSPSTLTPIRRNDVVHKKHKPIQYVTTYNFPPSSWGPYAAAVYEQPPIPSFLEDPFGYLAAILNPYNWFNGSFSNTNIPTTITTVVPDKNQEEVYVVVHDSDNEIPNEERMDEIEMKMGYQNIDNKKYITKRTPYELSTTVRDSTTASYNTETDTDLVAEETTIKSLGNIRRDGNFEADSRQFFGKRTQKTEPTEPPTRPTKPYTRTTKRFTKSTTPEIETTKRKNNTIPTRRPNTTSASNSAMGASTPSTNPTSASNSAMGASTPSTNPTSQTPYPLNNITYPVSYPGYYYGGYPQNVSHIELTTSKTEQDDKQIQNFNDVNQYLQPYQPNYQDFNELPSLQNFEFFKRSEQLPPLPNNYYDRNRQFTFDNMNDNSLNGFKPSFPLHF